MLFKIIAFYTATQWTSPSLRHACSVVLVGLGGGATGLLAARAKRGVRHKPKKMGGDDIYDASRELYNLCRDSTGSDPTARAALLGAVRALLDRGADTLYADAAGWTALMLACQEGHRDVAELLLDRGADVEQAWQDGRTALLLVRHSGHDDVVELLLSRGAEDAGTTSRPTSLAFLHAVLRAMLGPYALVILPIMVLVVSLFVVWGGIIPL